MKNLMIKLLFKIKKSFYSDLPNVEKFYEQVRNLHQKPHFTIFLNNDLNKSLLINPELFNGKIIAIIGDLAKGKTKLTTTLFLYYIYKFEIDYKNLPSIFRDYGYNSNIIAIDCAPESFYKENIKIGGKMSEFFSSNDKYNFNGYINVNEIIPPRSMANDTNELNHLIKLNYQKIHPVILNLYKFLRKIELEYKDIKIKIPIFIFINDISLYFHYKNYNKENIIYKIINICKKIKNILLIINSYLNLKNIAFQKEFCIDLNNSEMKSVKNLCKDTNLNIILI